MAELHLRQLIFDRLDELRNEQGIVTRTQLESLDIGIATRRVIDQSRGIWNPRDLSATLSIVSNPSGPYDDTHVSDALLSYDYRKGSTNGDNLKLRRAYELQLPILLLRKIEPNIYIPIYPCYVVHDDISNRRFTIALDENMRGMFDASHLTPIERAYADRITRQRLHQPEFRGRVMHAYAHRCSVCTLKHGRLLDAAHIISDSKPGGTPTVDNGLSLCKIHHAAYDTDLLGISPDYTVHINHDLLLEKDGPMLKHGLQEMHGVKIILPARRLDHPSKERLAIRFDEFRDAS